MSDTAIRYRFQAIGADSVAAAFKGIGKAAEESAVRVARTARAAASTARAAASGGGDGRRKLSETERLAAKVARDQEKAADREVRLAERVAKQKAAIRAREEAAEVKAKEKTAAAEVKSVAKMQSRYTASAVRSGAGFAWDVAKTGALATTGALALATRGGYKVDEIARRAVANKQLAGEGKGDITAVRQSFFDAARAAPGQTAEDVGQAALSYQGITGQLADVDTLKVFTTVASGAGAAIKDVAEAAGALSNNLNIKDVDDMAEALGALAVQGAKGQFELKDAASLMGRISAAAGGANWDKSVKGVKSLGGLMQISARGAGGAENAATAIQNVMSNMMSAAHQKYFKQSGVNTFVKGTNNRELRNVNDVLVESFVKTKGDKTKLGHMYGEQAAPVINTLSSIFNDEMKANGGNAAKAGEVLRQKLEEAASATNAYKLIQQAAATAQESAGAKLAKTWEDIQGKVSDKLLPTFGKLVDKMEAGGALDAFVDGLTFAAEALADMGKMLADLGLVSKKAKDPWQEKSAADKAFEKQRKRVQSKAFKDMSPEEQFATLEEFGNAVGRKAKADNIVAPKDPKEVFKEMSREEFASQYQASLLGGGTGAGDFMAKAISEKFPQLREQDSAFLADRNLEGETDQSRALRMQYASQTQYQQSKMLADGRGAFESDSAGKGMANVAAAAERAAAALSKIEANARPSIIAE